jgi:hypothetical protein
VVMSPRAVCTCCAVLFALNARAASLGEALDNSALNWRTGGDAPWIGQTAQSFDGIDAGESGLIGDLGESWVEVAVTGPGPLSFWWNVSSEEGYDRLEFLIDEVEQINISGTNHVWEQWTFDIPSGVHTLTWRYTKDLSRIEGLDRGWLDQVSYTPPSEFAPIIYDQPQSRTVAVGATVTFSVSGAGWPEPTYQWFHNTAIIPGATNPVFTLNGVTPSDGGLYTVVLRNSQGSITSAPATLIVTLIGDVVESPELNWIIGGEGSWFGQSAVTHDGVDALQSGVITNLQESWVQTRVTGPGVVVFWWKVSSEPFYDGLQFRINDDVPVASLSGDAEWEQKVLTIPPGQVSLRWRYFKDGSITLGQDRGWLDEVTFIPNKTPTNLVLTLNRQSIVENDSVLLSGSFVDPDPLDTHTVLINWQDGSSNTVNLADGVYSFSATHQYRDDVPSGSSPDNFPISVTVSDRGGAVTGSSPLTVSNLPPVLVSLSLTSPIFPYETATLTGSVADTGALDSLRLVVHWGDSINTQFYDYPPGVTSFLLRHTYSLVNTNVQITLTGIDDDQGAFVVRTNLTIRPVPVGARILSVRKLQNGNALLTLQGTPSATYHIEGSADLIEWVPIALRTAAANGLFEADEPGGFTFRQRFYRAIWEPVSD